MRYHARSATVRVLLGGSVASLIGALSLGACKGDITSPFNFGQLVSIGISGDSVVTVGDTIRLSTRGKIDGIIGILASDRVLDAVWSVSNPTIVSVTPVHPPPGDSTSTASLLVRGVRAGSVQVTATARKVSGTTTVRVVPAP